MAKRNRKSYKEKQKYAEAEIGSTGLSISCNRIREDVIPAIRGDKKIKLLEEMVNFDPTIGAFNNMFQSIASSVDWSIKPKDDSDEAMKVKDFIEECLLKDLNVPFSDAIKNALTACQYGFAILEPVYKIRKGKQNDPEKTSLYDDGYIGLSKLAPRYQGSIHEWNFDEKYKKILSITQKNLVTMADIEIPYKRVLHFKFRSFNNNPEGKSIYFNCVVPYLKKKNTSLQEDIRYERGFDGILDIKAPAVLLDPCTKNPAYIQTQKWIRDTAQNIRSGTDVAIAHPEYIKVDILSSGDGNIPNADKIIEREDRNIAVALLSDFFLTSQKSAISGGFTQSKIKIFTNLVKEMLEEIRSVINLNLIPKLLDKNLLDSELMPTLEYSEIGDLDLTNIMLLLQSAKANKLVPANYKLCNLVMKTVFGNNAIEFTEEEYNNWLASDKIQQFGYLEPEVAGTAVADISDDDSITVESVEKASEESDNQMKNDE